MNSKKWNIPLSRIGITAAVTALLLAVVLICAADPASAASSKKVNLIKDSDIEYFENGLVKSIRYDSLIIGCYDYDPEGRITEARAYAGAIEPDSLAWKFNFKYDKKGKLTKVIRVGYQDGRRICREVCPLKVDKNNRILKLKFHPDPNHPKDKMAFQWGYDSKGRVKKQIAKAYFKKKLEPVMKTTMRRSKGGFLKKLVITKSGETVWRSIFKLRKKSGKVLRVRMKTAFVQGVDKFHYRKKSIDKELLPVVKAQQLDLLYINTAKESLNPAFYLTNAMD